MSDEISLSLEETNKVRLSLGLKPIPAKEDKRYVERQAADKVAPATGLEGRSSHFIQDDKIQMLRKKLTQLRGPISLQGERKDDTKKDWLDQIGKNKSAKKAVKITYDVEEDEMPLLRVSHKMPEVASGKGMILTLKENDIHAEDEDVLENENLVHDNEDAKRVELRKMNRDRKRLRKKLHVSSADIEADEEEESSSVLLVGAETNFSKEFELNKPFEDESGKVKVTFHNNDSDESDIGDYKTVTIKKRKKNHTNGRSKNGRIALPNRIEHVKLVDEDADDLEDDLYMPLAKKSRLESRPVKPEVLASEIKREKLEREQRKANIAQMSKGMIIDEGVTFLDSLKSNLVEKDDFQQSTITSDQSKRSEPSEITNPTAEMATKTSNGTPDFYNGLASTLNFLLDKNVLQPSEDGSTSKPAPFDHSKQVQEIRKRITGKTHIDHASYTAKELEEIKKYEDEQVAYHVNKVQNQRLEDYNPDVQLVYKDEKGNQLTTKEAYKKISQKFHGTKSNKKKLEKAQAKIESRKQTRQEPSVFDLL